MLLGQVFPIDQFWTNQQQTLFFNVRLPRILLALMVGCCLAGRRRGVPGNLPKTRLCRPIPGRVPRRGAWSRDCHSFGGRARLATSLFAFCFAIATVFLVLLISSRAKGNRILVVVLAALW